MARPGGFTDWSCHQRQIDSLEEMVTRYAQLSAVPAQTAGPGRRAPGYHSRPPVNLHVAALRDPRTRPLELGEPHSAVNFAMSWGQWLRETRRQDPIDYPGGGEVSALLMESEYLADAMDWITRQEWVGTFAGQLRVVVRQLRAATGEPNPRPVSWCRAVYPDGSACGHPLFPPPEGTGLEIQCGACAETYDPLSQIRLRRADMAEGRDGAGQAVCAACGHASAQHSNDDDPRPCNSDWCSCRAFTAEDLA